MNSISETTTLWVGLPNTIGRQIATMRSIYVGMTLIACLTLLGGCSSTSTTVGRVWKDDARGKEVLGKTLVLALFSATEFAIPIEDEWVRQLNARGIQAEAAHALLPDTYPPDKESVVGLVKAEHFKTLLEVELVNVKNVERDISASQTAVVDTKLYDTATEQPFWTARSQTFMLHDPEGEASQPRSVQIRWYVEKLLKAMSRSNVLQSL